MSMSSIISNLDLVRSIRLNSSSILWMKVEAWVVKKFEFNVFWVHQPTTGHSSYINNQRTIMSHSLNFTEGGGFLNWILGGLTYSSPPLSMKHLFANNFVLTDKWQHRPRRNERWDAVRISLGTSSWQCIGARAIAITVWTPEHGCQCIEGRLRSSRWPPRWHANAWHCCCCCSCCAWLADRSPWGERSRICNDRWCSL